MVNESRDKVLSLTIDSYVGHKQAQKIVTRIRASIQNNIKNIELRWQDGNPVEASEFIGFLVVTGRYLKKVGGSLKLLVEDVELARFLEFIDLGEFVECDLKPADEGR